MSAVSGQDVVKHVFDRRRTHPEKIEARHSRRDDGVALQELDLIAGQRGPRQELGDGGDGAPERERNRQEQGPPADMPGDQSQEILIAIDIWTTQLENMRLRIPSQTAWDRAREILDIDRLQTCPTSAEQRESRQSAPKLRARSHK